MNTTEVLMAVKRPDGKPATIDQLRHARNRGKLDPPDGGWSDKHVEQLQEYVDQVKTGRPAAGEK